MHTLKLATIALSIAFAGCVTQQIIQKAPSDVHFDQFKTVAYSVHAASNIEIEQSQVFSNEEIALFSATLGQRLKAMGYQLADDPSAADFIVDVSVTTSKEGSAAARFLVGFGAGRAVMMFNASFDSHGRRLAAFEGGKSVTGQAFADKDTLQMDAVTRGTRQITEFIRNNGDIPQAPQAKPPRM